MKIENIENWLRKEFLTKFNYNLMTLNIEGNNKLLSKYKSSSYILGQVILRQTRVKKGMYLK